MWRNNDMSASSSSTGPFARIGDHAVNYANVLHVSVGANTLGECITHMRMRDGSVLKVNVAYHDEFMSDATRDELDGHVARANAASKRSREAEVPDVQDCAGCKRRREARAPDVQDVAARLRREMAAAPVVGAARNVRMHAMAAARASVGRSPSVIGTHFDSLEHMCA